MRQLPYVEEGPTEQALGEAFKAESM